MSVSARYSGGTVLAQVLIGVLVCWGGAGRAADNYLDAIDAEAVKVEDGVGEEGAKSTGPGVPTEQGAVSASSPTLSQQEFEDVLSKSFHGSYTFYRKLPERSRKEIYESYKRGASMNDIRKKIMDRFLNY